MSATNKHDGPAGATYWFAHLTAAVERHDFILANEATSQLARLGFDVRPTGNPGRPSPECEAFLAGLAIDSVAGSILTPAGRKAAVLRLKSYGPKLSIRKLAKLAGVDERQARRWLAGAKDATEGGEL